MHIRPMDGWALWVVTPPLTPGAPLHELYIVAESDKVEAMQAIAKLVGEGVEIAVAGPVSKRTIELLKLEKGGVHNAAV